MYYFKIIGRTFCLTNSFYGQTICNFGEYPVSDCYYFQALLLHTIITYYNIAIHSNAIHNTALTHTVHPPIFEIFIIFST